MNRIYLVYCANGEIDSAYRERHGAELRVRELVNDLLWNPNQERWTSCHIKIPVTKIKLTYNESKYNTEVKPAIIDKMMFNGITRIRAICEDGDTYDWFIDVTDLW